MVNVAVSLNVQLNAVFILPKHAIPGRIFRAKYQVVAIRTD